MNDFITEAWLRANHTLSEGGEIHLPANARLTPSARELLESRHLRVKFLDRQGRLFVEDDEQTPQPVHVLTSRDHPPQACCELCHQPVDKKPDTLTHLTADTLVAKNDPRLAFRAVLDSTIALTVWLQIELAESWQPWLMDIRSRLGNIMRADALEEPLAAQSIAGFSEGQLHRLSHQPLRFLGHDHLVPEARHGREVALLNLLRGKVRDALQQGWGRHPQPGAGDEHDGARIGARPGGRGVVHLLHDPEDIGACGLGDALAAVDGQRNGGGGDTGALGNVLICDLSHKKLLLCAHRAVLYLHYTGTPGRMQEGI